MISISYSQENYDERENGGVFEEELRRGTQTALRRGLDAMEIRSRRCQEPNPKVSHGRRSRQARRGRKKAQEPPGPFQYFHCHHYHRRPYDFFDQLLR